VGDRAHGCFHRDADQVIEETAAIYETNVCSFLGAGCPNRNKQAFGGLGDNNNREPIMNKRTYLARNSYPTRAKSHWFFLVLLLLSSATTFAAPVPTVEDIIASLGLKQDQVANLERGEIVALEIGEATEKELAMGLGIYLPSPLAKLLAYFKSGALASIDPIPWLKAMRSQNQTRTPLRV
jgi:hypothetical protein